MNAPICKSLWIRASAKLLKCKWSGSRVSGHDDVDVSQVIFYDDYSFHVIGDSFMFVSH